MAGRKPSVETKLVVKAIALHPEPVVVARDIHEAIGLTPDGARERLKALEQEGVVKSKQAGSSALVFWLTDEGRSMLSELD